MKTNIEVTIKTRDRLKSLGHMGDTYDKVIERLLDVYEDRRKNDID